MAKPIKAFTEEFREVYWNRTELNQRELAAALHLSKSPVSRYLNGQEIIPEQALEVFCELARLTIPERERLRTLREKAETRTPDDRLPPAPAQAAGSDRRPWYRRTAVWLLTAAALAAIAVVVTVTNTGSDAPSAAPPPGSPACHQTRQYTVTEDGDILDEHHNDIGDVHHGELFTLDTAPSANPYQSRYYGHADSSGITGYVDKAKLKYTRTICS